jgi:hypothetical protein
MTGTKPTWLIVVVVVFLALVRPPWRVSPQAQQAVPARTIVALDTSLSGLPHGDYLFELTVGSRGATEQHLLAIRVSQ